MECNMATAALYGSSTWVDINVKRYSTTFLNRIENPSRAQNIRKDTDVVK